MLVTCTISDPYLEINSMRIIPVQYYMVAEIKLPGTRVVIQIETFSQTLYTVNWTLL